MTLIKDQREEESPTTALISVKVPIESEVREDRVLEEARKVILQKLSHFIFKREEGAQEERTVQTGRSHQGNAEEKNPLIAKILSTTSMTQETGTGMIEYTRNWQKESRTELKTPER